MNEKKGNYIIVSEYNHFCIIENGFKKDAIEIAKIMEEIEKDNNPRIFKIEREINWRKQEKEDKVESKENSVSMYDVRLF